MLVNVIEGEESRIAILDEGVARQPVHRARRAGADRREHLQGARRRRRAEPAGGVRGLRRRAAGIPARQRHRAGVVSRSGSGAARGQAGRAHRQRAQARTGNPRAGHERGHPPQGAGGDDVPEHPGPLPGPHAVHQAPRHLQEDRRRGGARGAPQRPRRAQPAEEHGHHRPHRRGPPQPARPPPRHELPAPPLDRHPETGQDRLRAGGAVRGERPGHPRRPRRVLQRDRERSSWTRRRRTTRSSNSWP